MDRRTFLVLGSALTAGAPTAALAADSLDGAFTSPPPSARPHTWWHWMNGNITAEGITADLDAMARVGIGGAQIFNVDQGVPAGPIAFGSPAWRKMVVHAATEAKRVGIELCLHNCAGWSSSGGPWIDPPRSMQILTSSETPSDGGSIRTKLPEPTKRMGFYRDICVLAIPRSAAIDSYRIPDFRTKACFDRGASGLPIGDRGTPKVTPAPAGASIPVESVHVLRCAADGAVDAALPAGSWTLIRLGHTSTGKDNHPAPEPGRGLECDKLSRTAMDWHWAHAIQPLLDDLGPALVGTALNNSLIDSYEVGSQNWTDGFDAEFRRRNGYDPLPWLATVTGRVVGDAERSERFLWDLRRTIADLFALNYVGRFRELCHEHRMKMSVEPYGNGPFDNLQVGALADIPMGEFWVGGGAAETIKIAASVAHTTGRSVVGAESFTADDNRGRWLVEPYGVKTLGDRMFAQGLNRCVFHRYAHQPWTNLEPGMTMGPWGMHLERTVTWWEQGRAWLSYLTRCQFLLQSGKFVADVLAFCGDDAPGDLWRPALPPGFDYDGCDRTVLATAKVERGEIVLGSGARYRCLLLPDSPWMTPATLGVIARLSAAGATIVGRAPQKSPSLAGFPGCDTQIAHVASGLKLVDPAKLAQTLGMPDVRFAVDVNLPWIHRRDGDTDLYFVSNPNRANRVIDAEFRVTGRVPELWRPESGAIEDAVEWRPEPGRTRVTLRLGPAESIFVVFRRSARGARGSVVDRIGGPPLPDSAPVEILSARYEAVDGSGGADVIEKVRSLVASGGEIEATNANFGDPTVNRVKRLRVTFRVDGKTQERSVGENETLDLTGAGVDARLPAFEIVRGRLRANFGGSFRLTEAGMAKVRVVDALAPEEIAVAGPWTLAFPPGKGAPASISLPELISWTAHPDPGVRYFSGSAVYTTTVNIPASSIQAGRAVVLDLAQVRNFAEVSVNGRALPTLWKAPWRLDVTGVVRPGANAIQIRVTNLWVNRLIGDEKLAPEVEYSGPTGPIARWPSWIAPGAARPTRPATSRVAFSTWRFWNAGDEPLVSGLLGPVRLLFVHEIALKGRS